MWAAFTVLLTSAIACIAWFGKRFFTANQKRIDESQVILSRLYELTTKLKVKLEIQLVEIENGKLCDDSEVLQMFTEIEELHHKLKLVWMSSIFRNGLWKDIDEGLNVVRQGIQTELGRIRQMAAYRQELTYDSN